MSQGKNYKDIYKLEYLAFYKGKQCTIKNLIEKKAIIKDEMIASVTKNLIICSDLMYLDGIFISNLPNTFVVYVSAESRITLSKLREIYKEYENILNNDCKFNKLDIVINLGIS